jgi:hypothetical protein
MACLKEEFWMLMVNLHSSLDALVILFVFKFFGSAPMNISINSLGFIPLEFQKVNDHN